MKIKFFVFLFIVLHVVADAVVHQPNRATCPGVTLKNGKVRKRHRFIKFICNSGFLLAGERHSTCSRGKWDPPAPKCVRATCATKPKPPTNGLIYPSHNGAALHYFCRAGYVLRGPPHVFCDGKIWDNNSPICIAGDQKPKLFCDFEDDDICGWTHDLNHDFDWRREKYGTPSGSIGTGPSFDHTLGKGHGGHYMYIESSSRSENDTSRLISPVFDAIDTEVCLEFFYHMFGATIGTLRVYVKKSTDSWNLDPKRAIFSKSGNQGDRWFRSFHSLEYIDEEFQIVIEGVRGSGYRSDIAVDDINIIPNCTGDPDVVTTTEMALTETFPMIDSCENRCGFSEEISNESSHLTCDCDDNCYDNNRCCLDFFDFCVLASTTTDVAHEIVIDDFLPSSVSSIPIVNTSERYYSLAAKGTTKSDNLLTKITTKTTLNESKLVHSTIPMALATSTQQPRKSTSVSMATIVPKTTGEVTTKRVFFKTPVPPPRAITGIVFIKPSTLTPKVIKKLPTPKMNIRTPFTRKTVKTTPTTIFSHKSTTRKVNNKPPPRKNAFPKIYIKTPPTTTKIIRKIVPYTPKPLPKSTEKLYPANKPSFSNKESEYNDVIDVSIPKNNDETLLITSPFPEDDYSKEIWSEEVENRIDVSVVKNFSETLKLLTQKEPDISNNHVMAIVVSSIGTIIFVIIIAVLVVRHFRFPRRRTFFSNGISQSDVRFFSNDENLDFTLDNEVYGTI